MPRTKANTAFKPTPLKITKTSKLPTNRVKELEATVKTLQLRLDQEKDDHQETQARVTALQNENAQKGGLKMKRLHQEVEDLTEKLETEQATTGRLKIQLRHERELREKRDGTTGFAVFWKNDPELWMADRLPISVGDSGSSKRKRAEGGDERASRRNQAGRSEPKIVNEDILAQKKKDNDAFTARRKGHFDEDDDEDEEELTNGMRIKLEERKVMLEKQKVKKEVDEENAGPIITNKSQDIMDIDDLF